ncbi:hypothetical protein [Microbacterium caowuchunii]|uniref:Uncharacterized protein n=1 Tax=Microbacterium caowuchunii TaxID=2614638 RepID=A0A5N0TIN1_9MICO|nr:hypothetical protein [Microbacterium caowuchunii]KAA9134872.1 hypothetical protein F6B40_04030 [Microbacterium caowuchunii]
MRVLREQALGTVTVVVNERPRMASTGSRAMQLQGAILVARACIKDQLTPSLDRKVSCTA